MRTAAHGDSFRSPTTASGPPHHGPAGPFSLRTVHRTVLRALEPICGWGGFICFPIRRWGSTREAGDRALMTNRSARRYVQRSPPQRLKSKEIRKDFHLNSSFLIPHSSLPHSAGRPNGRPALCAYTILPPPVQPRPRVRPPARGWARALCWGWASPGRTRSSGRRRRTGASASRCRRCR